MRTLLITREGFQKWTEIPGYRPPMIWKIARMGRVRLVNEPIDPRDFGPEDMVFHFDRVEKEGDFWVYVEK